MLEMIVGGGIALIGVITGASIMKVSQDNEAERKERL